MAWQRSIRSKAGSCGGEIEMNRMLTGGARWAVEQGYGRPCDLDRIEEGGWQTQCLTPFRIERVSASGTRWAGSAKATIIWKRGR
jgi:RNA-splicing ligase RtcB